MLVPRTGVMLHVMVKVTCRSHGGTYIYDKVGLRHTAPFDIDILTTPLVDTSRSRSHGGPKGDDGTEFGYIRKLHSSPS
jgi:hypothetical protein